MEKHHIKFIDVSTGIELGRLYNTGESKANIGFDFPANIRLVRSDAETKLRQSTNQPNKV